MVFLKRLRHGEIGLVNGGELPQPIHELVSERRERTLKEIAQDATLPLVNRLDAIWNMTDQECLKGFVNHDREISIMVAAAGRIDDTSFLWDRMDNHPYDEVRNALGERLMVILSSDNLSI